MDDKFDLNDEIRTDGVDAVRTRLDGAKPHKRTVRFKLVEFDELHARETSSYLIKGVFPARGLVIVWGPPKCGKSFWTMTTMLDVAIGRDYRGHRVHQGIIIYLALEGQSGFPNRATAFRQRHLEPGEKVPAFKLCGASLDLIKDHPQLIADIKAQSTCPVAIVIDTMNRSLVGSESKDEDMAAYLRAADALQQAFECVVIIVHHCGHDDTRPRGHSSLIGAADVLISVKKDATGNVIATVGVAKDMADGATFSSRLEVVTVGTDEDGDPVTSCVVMPVEGEPQQRADQQRKLPKSEQTFLDAFTEAIDTEGADIRVMGDGPLRRAVDLQAVRAQFCRRYLTGEADPKKRADTIGKAFRRALRQAAAAFTTETRDDIELIWKI